MTVDERIAKLSQRWEATSTSDKKLILHVAKLAFGELLDLVMPQTLKKLNEEEFESFSNAMDKLIDGLTND